MEKTQHTDSTFNLERELDLIAEQARGCDRKTVAYSMALIICLAHGRKFQNGIYTPDPSDRNCRYYDQIVSALSEAWDNFVYIGRDKKLGERIERIQAAKLPKSAFRNALNKWLDVIDQAGGNETLNEPKEIRELVIELLHPESVVFNPFGGTAKYGEMLKLGDGYVGNATSRESWGIGLIRLLMAGSPSREWYCETVPFQLESDMIHIAYPNVITTLPLRYSVTENDGRSVPIDDFILSRTDVFLMESGRMVAIVPVSFLNRGGKSAEIRKKLTEEGWLANVITLPMKVFQHYSRIQTAIIILEKDEHRPAHFLNATKCIKQEKLDTKGILKLMGNENYSIPVSLDRIRERGYSWHPAKYEDDVPYILEPGHSKRQLKSFIIPTGRKEYVSGQIRCVTLSDLSNDPFSFHKSQNDIKMMDLKERQNEEIEKSVAEVRLLESELAELSAKYKAAQEEVDMIHSAAAEEAMRRREILLKQKAVLDSEIMQTVKELDDIRSEFDRSGADGVIPNAIYDRLYTREKEAYTRLENLKKQSSELELTRSDDIVEMKLRARLDTLEQFKARIADLQERLERANKKLVRRAGLPTPETAGAFHKVVHPALIIGGIKPKVQFAYVEASPTSPVYIGPSSCHAFKVDQDHIDLGYLVYIISTTEFRDYGASLPIITEAEILESYVDIINDIDEQRAFVHEREMDANPLKREIDAMRREFDTANAKYDRAIGYKRHEMGHYMYQIGNSFNRIYRIIRNEADFRRKEEVYRQMYMIEDSMKGINGMLDRLGEKDIFGQGSPLDLLDYFDMYMATSHPDGYEIGLTIDRTTIDPDMKLICLMNQDAFDSAIHCIRQNAEGHGFKDDPSRNDYRVQIMLSYDRESDRIVIDFINNGTPMDKGVDDDLYASPEGKAGKHQNTGTGGAFVCDMAKFYGGECHVNPEGVYKMFDVQTTIRVILPYYHE
ncbi:MAG: N-6 DNA methylase [Spirochaetales bacterium]|nr:N-6 DNA methylase [Spirochaetales bacterium]